MVEEGTLGSPARDAEQRLLAKVATLESLVHAERKRNEALLLKAQQAEDKSLAAQVKLESAVDKLEDFELKASKFEQTEDLYHELKIAYARLKDENEQLLSETELVLEDKNEEIERLGNRLEEVPVAEQALRQNSDIRKENGQKDAQLAKLVSLVRRVDEDVRAESLNRSVYETKLQTKEMEIE